ncbi:hypothetical protein BKA57DRAFT_161363 [Linnemannia elongata]|nr:hypothetical protein BKA57DRAFT_161363 [Linnemannia elongata]
MTEGQRFLPHSKNSRLLIVFVSPPVSWSMSSTQYFMFWRISRAKSRDLIMNEEVIILSPESNPPIIIHCQYAPVHSFTPCLWRNIPLFTLPQMSIVQLPHCLFKATWIPLDNLVPSLLSLLLFSSSSHLHPFPSFFIFSLRTYSPLN